VLRFIADTSALIKVYHPEQGAEFMAGLVHRSDVRMFVSPFTLLEFESVLAIKQRSKQIEPRDAEISRARLTADLTVRLIRTTGPLTPGHLTSARVQIERFGVEHGLRGPDAIQLVVALEHFNLRLISCFLSADRRLLEVAGLCGLPVINPESRKDSDPALVLL
jgi:predicted nucleic acid-binding protein